MIELSDAARQELLKAVADKGKSPTVRVYASYG